MSWKLDVPNTFKPAERPFSLPNRLLISAGPCNCSPRVLGALAQPTISPSNSECYQLMDDIQEMLKYVFQTKNEITLAIQNLGCGGLEAVLTNLVDAEEKVLVLVGGVWGDRTAQIANMNVSNVQDAPDEVKCKLKFEDKIFVVRHIRGCCFTAVCWGGVRGEAINSRHLHRNMVRKYTGMDVVTIRSGPGEVFTFDEIEQQLIKHKPVLLFVTQGESSAGTNQPLDGLGDICQKYDCLLAVDAVVSLGAVPLFVDRWKIDACISASQKAIGAPAGMSFMTFGERAKTRMFAKKKSVPYYYDIKLLGNAWLCFGNERTFHYTYNSNMLAAVREALAQIVEEGLENVWKRHQLCAERFWAGLEKINIKLFVPKIEDRLHNVTPILLPPNTKWPVMLNYIMEKYQVDIGFGLGPTLNIAVRPGFMGINATPEVVDYALMVLEDGFKFAQSEAGQVGPSTRSEVSLIIK